jgi:hypothetical protein
MVRWSEEQKFGKVLQGSNHGLIKILSEHLPGIIDGWHLKQKLTVTSVMPCTLICTHQFFRETSCLQNLVANLPEYAISQPRM